MTKKATAAGFGGVGAALLASVCCIGPLVAGVLGVGSAGFAVALEPWRPLFFGATAVALGFGFYQAYRRQPKCADGSCEKPKSRRGTRLVMWGAAIVSLLSLGFPYYCGFLGGSAQAQGTPTTTASETLSCTMKVEGMTCGGCEVHVASVLNELPGVKSVSADSEAGTATVLYDGKADITAFPKTVESKTPYKAAACQSETAANPKG